MTSRFKMISRAVAFSSAIATSVFFSSGSADAASIDGTTITIGSALNGSAMTYQQATVGAGPELTGGFSWMSSGDYIDLYDSGNPLIPNALKIYLNQSHVYQSSDIIHMSIQLGDGWAFDPYRTALVAAIDMTVPTASFTTTLLANDTLTFDLAGLDQLADFGGYITYKFDAVSPPSAVPVPASLPLFGSGLLGLAAAARRRKARAA